MSAPSASALPAGPRIRTTTVGSYPIPDWLAAHPREEGVIDATRVVFSIQRQAGIDLPTDGELYRFDLNHPDTNGMIEYFLRPLAGARSQVGRSDMEAFARLPEMKFRSRPAAVIESALGSGGLNLLSDCKRAAAVSGGPFKFTITSPYMLARSVMDRHYPNFRERTLALAAILAEQAAGLPCACLQVDEANITGNPSDAPLAAEAINVVLRAFHGERAVHLCFGNYGGQAIQKGEWKYLIDFLNSLEANHVILETARRENEIAALKDLNPRIGLGIGVVDIKINHVETADEIAARIERAEKAVGAGRVAWIHPDCGFWMLKRSVADRKIAALAAGRDLYLGIR